MGAVKSSRQEPVLNDGLRFKPVHAKALVCALGLAVFAVDMVVPADVNTAMFYCFVIVLCAWTRSAVFLWTAAAAFTGLVFPGLLLSPPPITGPVSWVDWTDRVLAVAVLWLVAAFIYVRMRSFRLLQATIEARRNAENELRHKEARLRLAQQAGRIGSWEWDPVQDTYTWSPECYGLFGIDSEKTPFAARWMGAIHPSDRKVLEAAMARCAELQEFELDYRYEHPSQGTRWIHTRARMFTSHSGQQRMFGISHDVTEHRQVESFLEESKSLLESVVEQRTAELRTLSAKLLQAQDEERRRIARELHDSFGQNLASLKINLDQLAGTGSSAGRGYAHGAELLADCLQTVERCIVETRTLSYLLHPPLLDEAGFASAARWYVEGFAKRSKIEARLELPPELPRLTPDMEMALFRALQESLTNVHRYSGSASVDIDVTSDAEMVTLTVRDYGRGISEEIVKKFREHGSEVGVGLSGMRERMNELAGSLEISSTDGGTTIIARVPLSNPETREAPLTIVA